MKILAVAAVIFLIAVPALADIQADSDNDGLSDEAETKIYKTDPVNPDSDGDGFFDGLEAANGYSPLNSDKVKLKNNDYDQDGLTDEMEIKFKTDLALADTDGDGYKDGEEITNAFNPSDGQTDAKLKKEIEIDLKNQKLSYFLAGVKLNEFPVSSGKNGATPKGGFKIISKSPKAWSPYGLWMPYWLGLGTGKFGIHELPVWPNGYREGENHLGKPVSHGCIRLGIGPAKLIYDWAEIGMMVKIY